MINKDKNLNSQTVDYNDYIELRSKVNELYDWYKSQKMVPKCSDIIISRFDGEPISRNYRIYPQVLEEFKEFCDQHKEYKVQELISQALAEFIEKYN